MSAWRHQALYNGITFNRVFGGTDPDDPASMVAAYQDSDYRLTEFDDSPISLNDLSEFRQLMEGLVPNQVFEGMRLLRLGGRIIGASYADLEDKAWALRDSFSPATVRRLSASYALVGQFPDNPLNVLPFEFLRDTAAGTKALQYYARPWEGRPTIVGRKETGFERPFSAVLAAFDPRAYDQSRTQTTLADLAGGNNTVTNPGTAITYPQIRIRLTAAGAATVTLTNVTTGQSFAMNLSTSIGGYPANLWLLTEQGEIVQEDGSRTSRYHMRKTNGGFLTDLFLVPGANTITFTPATGIASVRFDFRGAYS